MKKTENPKWSRRNFMAKVSAMSCGASLLPSLGGSVEKSPLAEPAKLTARMLADAERFAGLCFTEPEREMAMGKLRDYLTGYEQIRQFEIDSLTPPALVFQPLAAGRPHDETRGTVRFEPNQNELRPENPETLACLPVTRLAALIRGGKLTSLELTRLYLDRLKRIGPKLECVITLTEDQALARARRADREIREGHYRGPLHGIPWGAKDLFAARDYPTTWGANPYQGQSFDYDATVVTRLKKAGAVLVAKLTLGALAMGDHWFGGQTRNPWDTEKGSSGSSAGSAAATSAGLVGFALGTETCGSIVSPATVCGATGLRPTFGRVSRHGAMPLSWSMDKIGPICRSVEDCALVFDAIRGTDGKDPSVVDRPFNWGKSRDLKSLKVGYLKKAFDQERKDGEWKKMDLASLDTLRDLGCQLTPIELPELPVSAMWIILEAEAAAAFDSLTREDRDDLLKRQSDNAWPNIFRAARMIPAVEYIQANRLRTIAMDRMAELMNEVDLYVTPVWGGDNLLLTNLTGHPCVTLPNGFRKDGRPTGISLVGRLYDEETVLTIAQAYQEATGFHLNRPSL